MRRVIQHFTQHLSSWLGLCALSIMTACSMQPKPPMPDAPRWLVYYGEFLDKKVFAPYDLVVLEGQRFADVRPYKSEGQVMLGYLSIGEVNKVRPYFDALATHKALMVGENKQWDSAMVDVRNPVWREYFLNILIPHVLQFGYDGVMLDTADSVIALEASDESQYRGMRDALISLIKQMRVQYPNIKIMLNRGFEVLPELASTIDYALLESVRVEYDLTNDKGTFIKESYYESIVNSVKKHQLPIYTLDYWDMKDPEGVKQIYEEHRKWGMIPYVSRPDLQLAYDEQGNVLLGRKANEAAKAMQ